MELFAKSLHHFRGKLGIQGIHLTGFSRGQMDDQKRDNGDEKEGDDLLYDTSANKR